jgi:hypothetical protein
LFRHSGVIVTPVKTGVHPHPLTWIPFFNGMTGAVRHLDGGVRRHDKLSLRLKPTLSKIEGARDLNHPERDINFISDSLHRHSAERHASVEKPSCCCYRDAIYLGVNEH